MKILIAIIFLISPSLVAKLVFKLKSKLILFIAIVVLSILEAVFINRYHSLPHLGDTSIAFFTPVLTIINLILCLPYYGSKLIFDDSEYENNIESQ